MRDAVAANSTFAEAEPGTARSGNGGQLVRIESNEGVEISVSEKQDIALTHYYSATVTAEQRRNPRAKYPFAGEEERASNPDDPFTGRGILEPALDMNWCGKDPRRAEDKATVTERAAAPPSTPPTRLLFRTSTPTWVPGSLEDFGDDAEFETDF